jgi:hypothetical protein
MNTNPPELDEIAEIITWKHSVWYQWYKLIQKLAGNMLQWSASFTSIPPYEFYLILA